MSFAGDLKAYLAARGMVFSIGSQYPALNENELWESVAIDDNGITTRDFDLTYWDDDIYMGPSLSEVLGSCSLTSAVHSVAMVNYKGFDPGSELHLWTAHKRWIVK